MRSRCSYGARFCFAEYTWRYTGKIHTSSKSSVRCCTIEPWPPSPVGGLADKPYRTTRVPGFSFGMPSRGACPRRRTRFVCRRWISAS